MNLITDSSAAMRRIAEMLDSDAGGESPLFDQIGGDKDLMVLTEKDEDERRAQALMAEMNRWVLALQAERN